LSQHRNDQTEGLDHSPSRSSGIVISESDHHHLPRRSLKSKSKHSRSKSQFSVLQQEHLTSKHSFFDEQGLHSEGSYDPYRASREPSIPVKNRAQSSGQRPLSEGGHVTGVHSNRKRNSLRVETLRRQRSKRASDASRQSTSIHDMADRLSVSSHRSKSHSRTSTSSSHWLGGTRTPIVMRPSDKHKRNVSFDHVRRRSAHLSGRTPNSASQREQHTLETSSILDHSTSDMLPSSPPLMPISMVRSIKEGLANNFRQTPRTQRIQDIEIAARKVSNELGKVCEEAFFRSSMSDAASFRSSTSGPPVVNSETPPSSVSNRSSHPSSKLNKAMLNRPLPPTPREESYLTTGTAETPGTYTARELSDMRERLASRYEKDGASTKKCFNEILRQIDSLLPPKSKLSSTTTGGYTEGPLFLHSMDDFNLLQPIPEEGRFMDSGDLIPSPADPTMFVNRDRWSAQSGVNTHRLSTTIRVVEPSSPVTPTPLKIRKSSGGTTSNGSGPQAHHRDSIYGEDLGINRRSHRGKLVQM
jgi:serine/threonine-protein kinase HSL1 (negative regulator of Swe1 kinase)